MFNPSTLRRLAGDQAGASSIEYAAIASIISVGLILGYLLLSIATEKVYTQWTDAVNDAVEGDSNES